MTENLFEAEKRSRTDEISLQSSKLVENGSHESGTAKALNEALAWMNENKLVTIGTTIAVAAGAVLGGRALFSLAAKEGTAELATDRLSLETDKIFASGTPFETVYSPGMRMQNLIAGGMSKEEASNLIFPRSSLSPVHSWGDLPASVRNLGATFAEPKSLVENAEAVSIELDLKPVYPDPAPVAVEQGKPLHETVSNWDRIPEYFPSR